MLDFPLWLRAAHFFNFLLLSLLIRSGFEILSAHPRFYWNDHCTPGSEWLKFTRKQRPEDRLWTASDEERSFPSAIALPGHENLGLGRHWHFLADFAWLLTGLVYVVMLFVTPEWRRLIPTSWQIVPQAWHAMLSYLSFHVVETPGAYNALQQLSYAAVIFLLAPFSIATGVAMSPAVAARFPWYIRIFHGRQSARSLHFLALCAFIVFFIGHVTIVALHGFRRELALIVLGQTRNPHLGLALVVWLSGLTGIAAIHVVTTVCSRRRPRFVQKATQSITDPLRTLLFGHEISAQDYSPADISPYFWVNGRPPKEESYLTMARDQFANYNLKVSGLVDRPLCLTLADLRAMPKQVQITKHCCIQGWSGIAEWGGVSLHHIVGLCHPLPTARYIVFYAFDNKSTSEPHAQGPGYFYGTIRLALAEDPQTILAYEMNGQPLPILHGAPAPTSSRNAARIHHGEVHSRHRVYRGLQNHWPGPRRLARGLPVFQPGGGNLNQKVCTCTVLTVGHSTRTWKAFLDLLRAHRVERVIDVRSIPRSRHNPQFNQETLRAKLRAARIGYVHLRKLGGLRHARRDSSNMGWRNSSFRGFADYMQTPEFDTGLQRLIKLAGQKRSTLMCAEAVPWRCHRSLIADALTVLGIRVEDIMSTNRSTLHRLTSFGRVRHGRITYPSIKGSRLLSSRVRTSRKENGLARKG